jgi:hypothetical protein
LNEGLAPKRTPDRAWTNFLKADDSKRDEPCIHNVGKENFKQIDSTIYYDWEFG